MIDVLNIKENTKSKLCKSCIKSDVCMNDKNLFGDTYVAPNPWYYDQEYLEKSWENYKQRKAQGFPCSHYIPIIHIVSNRTEGAHGHWVDNAQHEPVCSVCNKIFWAESLEVDPYNDWNYCPNCGARMDEVEK